MTRVTHHPALQVFHSRCDLLFCSNRTIFYSSLSHSHASPREFLAHPWACMQVRGVCAQRSDRPRNSSSPARPGSPRGDPARARPLAVVRWDDAPAVNIRPCLHGKHSRERDSGALHASAPVPTPSPIQSHGLPAHWPRHGPVSSQTRPSLTHPFHANKQALWHVMPRTPCQRGIHFNTRFNSPAPGREHEICEMILQIHNPISSRVSVTGGGPGGEGGRGGRGLTLRRGARHNLRLRGREGSRGTQGGGS